MGVNKAKQYLHTLIQFCGRKKDKLKCALSLMLVVSLVLSLCINNAFVLAAQSGEQGEKHTHSFTCRELICQEEHDDGEHTKECFAADGPWLCGMEEGDRHIHNQDGYNCWVMAKELNCDATKSNADRDSGQEEDDLLSSGSNATRSGARRAKSGRKHIHTDGCYGEVYECRPQMQLMMLNAENPEWTKLKEKIEAGGTVTLESDITGEGADMAFVIKDGITVTLDLNGHTLEYVSTDPEKQIFEVQKGGTLIITDNSGQTIAEKITYTDKDDAEKEIAMSAGAIVGEGVDNAVSVGEGGKLTIKNGRITTVNSTRAIFAKGAVEMTGGYIVDNHNRNGGSNGGSNGGGVEIFDKGTWTMTGGVIANNSAANGGAIYAKINNSVEGMITIGGNAVICGNEADFGGAVYGIGNYTVNIEGNAVVSGNVTKNGSSKVIDMPDGGVNISETAFVQGMGNGLALEIEKAMAMGGDNPTLTLQQDYVVPESIPINGKITIDLNGYTITYSGYGKDQLFLVGASGNLTIAGTNGGKIKSEEKNLDNLINVAGGVLKITGGTYENVNGMRAVLVTKSNSGKVGAMEMTGGTITNCGILGESGGGGILVAGGSTLNMSGGVIKENRAQTGGGIRVSGAEATISGGRIIKNKAVGGGGGIYLTGTSKVEINGTADVSGNVADGNGKNWANEFKQEGGGGIYVEGGSTVSIGGTSVVSGNIANEGGAIYSTGTGYTEGGTTNKFAVIIENGVQITGNVSKSGNSPIYVSPAEKLNNQAGSGQEGELKKLIEESIAGGVYEITLGKSYVESEKISINLAQGQTFTMHLNDHIIVYLNLNESDLESSLFQVDNGTLIIEDQSGINGVIISREKGPNSLICVNNGALQLDGVRLENIGGSHGILAKGSTVTVNGGQIANSGQNVSANGDKDESASQGGGIRLENSTLNLNDSRIEGNKGVLGGGIYAKTGSAVNINNSEIIGNMAGDSGGGIYVSGGTVTVKGSTEISQNQAEIGGGMSAYDGAKVIVADKVKISNNLAKGGPLRETVTINKTEYEQHFGGGGIYLGLSSYLTLQDNCLIEQNRSDATTKNRGGGGNGGGGIFSRGRIVMKGGMIRDNYAKDSGGGIYAVGKFTMEGGTITGNTAQLDEGGGLRVDGKGSVITGGEITNNRTNTAFDWGGGGIFVNSGGELTIYNLLVNNNIAAGFGGGVGGCSSGDIEVCSLDGAAIYGNQANRTSLTDREGYSKRDDQKISEYDVFKNSGCDDYFCAGTSTVYGRMLGDIDAGWSGSFGNAARDAKGDKIKPDGYTVYRETGMVSIPADGSKHADGWLALTAQEPKDPSGIRPSVVISGNYSNTHGGGIMSNGVLRLGSRDNPSGLRVRKRVNGSQTDKEREYHFEVIFKNTSKQVDEYTYWKRNAEGTLRKIEPSKEISDTLNKPSEVIIDTHNQKVIFSLKHNENMEILELLKGTEYTITETGADDYGTYIILGHGEAVKVVEDNEEKTFSGSIISDTGATVMFTNSKSSLVIEKENKANKEEGEAGKAFAFTVTLENEKGIDGVYAYKKWTDGQPDVQEQRCTVSEGKLSLGDGTGGITLTHDEHIEIIGLPQGTKYTIEEIGAADYITDVSVSDKKVYDLTAGNTENRQNTKTITGTIEDENSAVTVKFINSKGQEEPVPKTGELRIAKQVFGEAGDRDKQFTFIVNLTDKEGKPLTETFQYRYDKDPAKTGTISDGGEVKLSHGESVTIYGLLEHTRYQVREVEANADGYTTVITGAGTVSADGSGISGEITSGELKEVTFTNKASEDSPEPGPEPGPEPEYGTLTIKKRVTGEAEPSNKEFAFKVILMDQEGNALAGEYPYTGSEHDGVISGEDPDSWIISLKDGQQATITDLPVGTIYLAEELEESRDGYVVSPLEEEGSITESGRDPVVEFVNRKIQPSDPEHGTLTVTKAVTGTDERKEFTFTVRLRDGLGRPIPGEYRYDGARSGMISDGGKVVLGHGESITIYGLPANARYHVVEQEANKDSYVTTVTGDKGVIQPGGNSYIDFINHKEENPGNPDNPNPTDPDLPPSTPETPGNPGNPGGGGGGGGGGRDRDNPTQPGTEGPSQTNPDVPTQPDGTPVLPEGSESQPGGPEPEGQAAPETETPIVTELPDPNDPASPDTVILMEDGVPRAYKKVWDPEKEEFVYMLDEDVPLAGRNMPKTGDPTRTNMWLILMILSLLGAGISWIGGRRRKDEDDRLL